MFVHYFFSLAISLFRFPCMCAYDSRHLDTAELFSQCNIYTHIRTHTHTHTSGVLYGVFFVSIRPYYQTLLSPLHSAQRMHSTQLHAHTRCVYVSLSPISPFCYRPSAILITHTTYKIHTFFIGRRRRDVRRKK